MSNYSTIHTAYGRQRMASAEAAGTSINLTHMAIGDGAGNATYPDDQQTALVREVYRTTINRVYQSPDDPTRFTAEMIIPAEVAGFTMREIGIFDDAGSLFVVGNLPATYKPMASEGAYADTIIRVDFMVSNASVVTLQIDPNVAVASQAWIINNITPATLLPGGTTGQMLVKQSNADGDAEWRDPDNLNVTVDCIEELQELAADQTIVDWAVVTTRGLAVYINRERVYFGVDWQKAAAPLDDTRIILTQSYPAGTKILGVQNEPTANAGDPLQRDLNLSDIENKQTARTNLGVYSKEEADYRGKRPGDLIWTTRRNPGSKEIMPNGALLNRAAYPELFAEYGEFWGSGDGVTTFQIPDLRGEFLRIHDAGRGIDTDRVWGSLQMDQFKTHQHQFGGDDMIGWPAFGYTRLGNVSYDATSTISSGGGGHYRTKNDSENYGGSETRPRNRAVSCFIYTG